MVQEAIEHLVGVKSAQRVNDEEGTSIKTSSIEHLVGVSASTRAERYPNVRIFNHDWHNPQALQTIGTISRSQARELTGGLLTDDVSVTLATGIPEERCRHINLGYADYREIDPEACMGREQEGILYVPHAGEVLYRARGI